MWPFSKKLEDVLCRTKKIKVFGVKFLIRKIDITDYLDGSKVMLQSYDIYKVEKNPEVANKHFDKMKEHFRDLFMASVLEPKLSRKKDDGGLFVDNLFTEWSLANKLYEEIVIHCYGKKKSGLSS